MEENPYASPQGEDSDASLGPLAMLGQVFEFRHWRLGTLACFILAALVAPADPISHFLVAISLLTIYWLCIALQAWLCSPKPCFTEWLGRASEFFEIRNWRFAALASFLVAFIVTPADPFSLFLVAIPLLAVYWLAVGLRAWLGRNHGDLSDAA